MEIFGTAHSTYYYSLQEGETEPVVNNFTSPCSFAYNHLGQLVQVIDAAGTRTLGYNNFGEQETGSLLADGVTHLITELRDEFGRSVGYIRIAYTYSPYGQVTVSGNVTQPIQWSSECYDSELGLVYYNYRHYNQVDGRWQGRDKYLILNIYHFCINSPFLYTDIKGNSSLMTSFRLSPIYNKNPQYAFFNYVTISALHNSNGAFSWNIKWIVSESGDKGGYVWQHVLFSSSETPCRHNKQTYKINKNYTELWRVKPNSTEIHEEEGRHDQLAYISNAVYKSNGGKLICSKGSAIFKTRAKYYPDLSEEFVKEFKIESNSAAGTLLMKDGFNPLKGDSIGERVRKVEMRWNNCSTVPTIT